MVEHTVTLGEVGTALVEVGTAQLDAEVAAGLLADFDTAGLSLAVGQPLAESLLVLPSLFPV